MDVKIVAIWVTQPHHRTQEGMQFGFPVSKPMLVPQVSRFVQHAGTEKCSCLASLLPAAGPWGMLNMQCATEHHLPSLDPPPFGMSPLQSSESVDAACKRAGHSCQFLPLGPAIQPTERKAMGRLSGKTLQHESHAHTINHQSLYTVLAARPGILAGWV